MNKHITSAIAGELTRDKTFPDWWNSNAVAIPFWNNKPMIITFTELEPDDDEAFVAEADEALHHFMQLDNTDREALSVLVKKNCDDFLQTVEYDEADDVFRNIKNAVEIWQFVYPTEIYVSRRKHQEQDIYIQLNCECDWEQEHGLQLIFRQGKKITRISAQDGHLTEADAAGKTDEEDELL